VDSPLQPAAGVECLENEDVIFSFGVPGEENMGKDG